MSLADCFTDGIKISSLKTSLSSAAGKTLTMLADSSLAISDKAISRQ